MPAGPVRAGGEDEPIFWGVDSEGTAERGNWLMIVPSEFRISISISSSSVVLGTVAWDEGSAANSAWVGSREVDAPVTRAPRAR